MLSKLGETLFPAIVSTSSSDLSIVVRRYEKKQPSTDQGHPSHHGQPYTKGFGEVRNSGYVPDEVEEALVATPFGKIEQRSAVAFQDALPRVCALYSIDTIRLISTVNAAENDCCAS